MWDREIEFPDHGLRLREILDILIGCLSTDELEVFAEQLQLN